MKFNKFSIDLNIKLIKAAKNNVSYAKKYIDNGEYLEAKPIDSNIKNKSIAYSLELLFGMLSFSSYVHIEVMKIISSMVEINEYKLLRTTSHMLVNALKQLVIAHFLGFHNQLKEKYKATCVNIDKKFLE